MFAHQGNLTNHFGSICAFQIFYFEKLSGHLMITLYIDEILTENYSVITVCDFSVCACSRPSCSFLIFHKDDRLTAPNECC